MSNLTGIDGTSNPKDANRVCARAEAGARGPCVRETSRQRRKAEISGAREFIKAGRNGKNSHVKGCGSGYPASALSCIRNHAFRESALIQIQAIHVG